MELVIVIVIILGALIVLVAVFLAVVYIPSPRFEPVAYDPITPAYWPIAGFRSTTPEEQGMDSAKLVEMVKYYEQKHASDPAYAIDSITIVRNGYVVADLYFNPMFPKDARHVIHSGTKSILSSLIGIAIDQGHIAGLDMPVMEFFKDETYAIADEGMRQVTLRDLLTMQTGVRSRDSYIYQWEGWFEMLAADDWIAYFFSLPMDVEPGTRFDYSNLSSFMLSAIIQESTGMDTLAYARKNLFDPLGIEDVYWEANPQGIFIGSARMWLKPHDMAKFGMLYLQKGQWDGRQLVPAGWIKESLTPHAFPKNYVDILDENGKKDNEASMRNWVAVKFLRPFADGYGYQWWLDKSGAYTALGTSGQYIMVVPEKNLVVAVTSSASGLGVFLPAKLLEKFILPAIASHKQITGNTLVQQELAKYSKLPPLNRKPQAVPELPATAWEISGKTYTLEANRWNYDEFQLRFEPSQDYAGFDFTRGFNDMVAIQVGLDGVFRFSETAIGTTAAVGRWNSPYEFEIEFQWIGYSAPTKFIMVFREEKVEVTEVSLTGTNMYSGQAIDEKLSKAAAGNLSGVNGANTPLAIIPLPTDG